MYHGTVSVPQHRLQSFLQTAEASREFDKCFPGQRDRSSAFLMWAEEEVEWFAERLDKQVFN